MKWHVNIFEPTIVVRDANGALTIKGNSHRCSYNGYSELLIAFHSLKSTIAK